MKSLIRINFYSLLLEIILEASKDSLEIPFVTLLTEIVAPEIPDMFLG
tara:strand:+ start:1076 stop:1219 length:144 start_codon:yes stop_codon:yes gene_type:complete